MPKIKTRTTFNRPSTLTRLRAISNDGLTIMGNQALKDITKHVPRDQGILQDSGETESDKIAHDLKFELHWPGPYAQYLWNGKVMHGEPRMRTPSDYGPDLIKFTSALAHAEWAKYAKEVYGENWKKVYQAAIQKGGIL